MRGKQRTYTQEYSTEEQEVETGEMEEAWTLSKNNKKLLKWGLGGRTESSCFESIYFKFTLGSTTLK